MWTTILLLLLLFVTGLISTNFPRKKFLAWFQSLCVEIKNPSIDPSLSHATTKHETVDADRKAARRSAFENKARLKSVFDTFDKNNDGYITMQELRDSLKNIGMVMSENDIADTITKLDSNGDGLIDLDEFCESFDSLLGRGEINEEEERNDGVDDGEVDLKDAFDVFDGDKDGVITVEELGLVLSSLGFKEGKQLEDCKKMIEKVDVDGDGMVNFDEFKKMMKAGWRLVPIS